MQTLQCVTRFNELVARENSQTATIIDKHGYAMQIPHCLINKTLRTSADRLALRRRADGSEYYRIIGGQFKGLALPVYRVAIKDYKVLPMPAIENRPNRDNLIGLYTMLGIVIFWVMSLAI